MPLPAEAAAPIDDVAEASPALVGTAALLADDLGQAFGIPEMASLLGTDACDAGIGMNLGKAWSLRGPRNTASW